MSLEATAAAAWVCDEVRRRGHGRADVSLVSRLGTVYEALAAISISSAPGLSTTPANWLRQYKVSLRPSRPMSCICRSRLHHSAMHVPRRITCAGLCLNAVSANPG